MQAVDVGGAFALMDLTYTPWGQRFQTAYSASVTAAFQGVPAPLGAAPISFFVQASTHCSRAFVISGASNQHNPLQKGTPLLLAYCNLADLQHADVGLPPSLAVGDLTIDEEATSGYIAAFVSQFGYSSATSLNLTQYIALQQANPTLVDRCAGSPSRSV
jgi:hypothetical protein